MPLTHISNGGAGYVEGVKRLGIPPLFISDAAYGVRDSGANGRYSTALPSSLAAASSWDTQGACEYGALIGRELRAQGFNMSLGGGVNLTREPRNGRTFEYAGEDPLLAGTMVGNLMKCEQAQHVIGDIKHFVAQRSGDWSKHRERDHLQTCHAGDRSSRLPYRHSRLRTQAR